MKGGETLGLLSWFIKKLNGEEAKASLIEDTEFANIVAEIYIRNLAFQSGVNLIANSISKCEFKTYFRGKEQKGKEYYLFNIEPNKNQNSSQFIHKLISKLYENNECLVIEANDQLLVADSFLVREFALLENQFTQVTVGDFTFDKTFYMSDVLYFKLNNSDIRKIINGVYESYGKLITYAQKTYQKTRGHRGILDVSALAQGKKDFQNTFDKLMNERFKKFFEAENAVLPLFEGYQYTDIGSKTYSNESTRDIRALIDDIYDLTARALRIPPALLRGDHANIKDVVDNYLTVCIDPLCDMMQEETNRKRSGYEGFKEKTYLKIDTKTIKHIDLLSVATSIDKLISSGAFCVNDIRIAVGDEPIEEPWAWQHFMTKNYSNVEDLLKTLEGGGNDG